MSKAGKPIRFKVKAYVDLGVRYARRGKYQSTAAFERVKKNPKRGQYCFNEKTGAYTFSHADNKRHITITQQYPA